MFGQAVNEKVSLTRDPEASRRNSQASNLVLCPLQLQGTLKQLGLGKFNLGFADIFSCHGAQET